MEFLQLDPLQMIARSQDIALHSRVIDYTPGLWEEFAYGRRQFFDGGPLLTVRPMDELPHWRVAMRRDRGSPARLHRLSQAILSMQRRSALAQHIRYGFLPVLRSSPPAGPRRLHRNSLPVD